MIRINLLPPEIIERRRYDGYYPYVFITAGILIVVILFSWGILQFVVTSRNTDLQRTEQERKVLQQKAEGLAVFELKESELKARQDTASKALAGRVDVGRLAEEVSLVLPEEVWASELAFNDMDGLNAVLYAPEPLGHSVSDGYKSAASTLVELSSLSMLKDVWLSEATVQSFTGFQALAVEAPSMETVRFTVSAEVTTPVEAPYGVGE